MADLGTPTKFSSLWIIGVCGSILIGWDIYAAFSPSEVTVSAVTLMVARHPIVPFLAGVLAGHLFWPQVKKSD